MSLYHKQSELLRNFLNDKRIQYMEILSHKTSGKEFINIGVTLMDFITFIAPLDKISDTRKWEEQERRFDESNDESRTERSNDADHD